MQADIHLINMAGLVSALESIEQTNRVRRETGGVTHHAEEVVSLTKRIIELTKEHFKETE